MSILQFRFFVLKSYCKSSELIIEKKIRTQTLVQNKQTEKHLNSTSFSISKTFNLTFKIDGFVKIQT